MTKFFVAFLLFFFWGHAWSQSNDVQTEKLSTLAEDDSFANEDILDEEDILDKDMLGEELRLDSAWQYLFPPAENCSLADIIQKAEKRYREFKKRGWEKQELDFSDYCYNSDMREWQKYFKIGESARPMVVAAYRKCREEGSDAIYYQCVAFNGFSFTRSDAPDMIPWKPVKSTGQSENSAEIAVVRPEINVLHFITEEPTVEVTDDEMTVSFPSAKKIVLRRIPAGTFVAGSPEGELGRPVLKSSPGASDLIQYMYARENQRLIKIDKDFWLGQCEVTNNQVWTLYDDWGDSEEARTAADMPAGWGIDWIRAMKFCDDLNKACEGKLPVGYKFSLPLEMQWEWGCRAGTTTAFNNGTDISIDANGKLISSTEAIGWPVKKGTYDDLHTVGGKAPNRFGLYDTHGNAEELCYDWVRPNPPLPGMLEIPHVSKSATQKLPWGCWDATSHILRGGCGGVTAACRSAQRGNCDDRDSHWGIGFRLALIPKELTPVAPSPFSEEEVRKNAVPPVPREEGLSVRLPAGIELSLERIPAGEFEMGSPEDEIGRTTKEYWNAVYDFAPEKAGAFSQHTAETRRKVAVEHAFWLGRFPVTREQYAAVIGADLSLLENGLRPMTQVLWEDAVAFCEKLNVLCAEQLPAGYRFAIPTEEQWEYACRAETTTALNSGKNLTQGDFFCPNLAEVAWFQMNSGERKRDVGLLKPNAWGLYDMHGNVWEWCVCTTPVDGNPLSRRILRGGSWYDPPRFCRSAMRRWLDEDRGGPDIGFRVALVPMGMP